MPKKSYKQFVNEINSVKIDIPVWSLWNHYKSQDTTYKVMDLVVDEASDSMMVIYEKEKNSQWVKFARLADIFLEDVTDSTWTVVSRFQRLSVE